MSEVDMNRPAEDKDTDAQEEVAAAFAEDIYEEDDAPAVSVSRKNREPLFHIVKRDSISMKKAWGIRAAAVFAALVVCGIIIVCVTKVNPFAVYGTMFTGTFTNGRRVIEFLHSLAILLCVSLAVTPAFKMRFWNIGAEGQVLIGGLATAACMLKLGGVVPDGLLIVVMLVSALVCGAIWGFIPAFFKAKWGTNETLFTLMLNYTAMHLIMFFLFLWSKNGSPKLPPSFFMNGRLPKLFGQPYILNILVVALVTVLVYVYLKYSKHGYEISVVGESENTARYVGINVKWVIIRTMLISGALCGLTGFLLVSGANYTISTDTAGGRGFDAIMVSWLAKFNPFFMILTASLLVFLERGASSVSTKYGLNNAFSEVLSGIILFFIIGCEFFIQYQVKFRHTHRKEGTV